MLKLRYETEDWREALTDTIMAVESELGVDHDAGCYDECADEFCRLTLQHLAGAGVEYQRAYQQSRGANCIVQGGTDAEIEALDVAMAKAAADVRDYVVRQAKMLAEC